MVVVVAFATFATNIIASAMNDWIKYPGVTKIGTFSKVTNLYKNEWLPDIKHFSQPVTGVAFPALTLCPEVSADPGEYLRAVFNELARAFLDPDDVKDQLQAFPKVWSK